MLLQINGLLVTLQRKRIKNINLRIKTTGAIHISAPIRTPMEAIHRFLYLKSPWIEMHRSRLLQVEQEPQSTVGDGVYLPFQGGKYLVCLHETKSSQAVELRGDQIHFFVKPKTSEAQKQLLLSNWYRKEMEGVLPPLFNKWQSIMGLRVAKISIKRMTSRWGSCNPVKAHISLNLRLIEKPLACLEYVIVHELVHLFEASHNHRFYALMSHYLPNWKQIKQQLS